MPSKYNLDKCPCGSGLPYKECCGKLHSGEKIAQNPEELLRGRFSGYALGVGEYVRDSWHPDFRPNLTPKQMVSDLKKMKLTKLEILDTKIEGNTGKIDYIARFRIGVRYGALHEAANYVYENGKWFYTDGKVFDDE